MANLIEGLQKEMNRVRELRQMYADLPGGVGFFGIATIDAALKEADKAIASGDLVKELRVYEDLKTIEG